MKLTTAFENEDWKQRRKFVEIVRKRQKKKNWRHIHHTSFALKWFRNAADSNLNDDEKRSKNEENSLIFVTILNCPCRFWTVKCFFSPFLAKVSPSSTMWKSGSGGGGVGLNFRKIERNSSRKTFFLPSIRLIFGQRRFNIVVFFHCLKTKEKIRFSSEFFFEPISNFVPSVDFRHWNRFHRSSIDRCFDYSTKICV